MDDFSQAVQSLTQQSQPTDFSQAVSSLPPTGVMKSVSEIGKHEDEGLCLQFAQDMAGVPHEGDTAIDEFNNKASEGQAYSGFSGIKPGDFVFFQGSNPAGHVGIVTSLDPKTGEPIFASATDNGVQEMPVSQWEKYAGQQYVGFTDPYGGKN